LIDADAEPENQYRTNYFLYKLKPSKMRILITGFIVLVVWSIFSMWLYVDILKPATRKQVVTEQPIPENRNWEADSLAKFYASMPHLFLYFDFDKAMLEADAETEGKIAELKAWMEKYPASVITVTGHTDFIGTPEYNLKLGLERAEAVKKFLTGKGIPSEKMVAASMGAEQPAEGRITSYGREKNRRTEVTIKK
jgi:outer membrane protein OmpA-like peptidoglycan-associated protein